MTENAKAYASTIVIVACLALLGVLVHEHVDPAITIAITIVPTLIAYFTRPPTRKDPPVGPVLVLVAALGTLLSAALSGGCSSLSGVSKEDKAAAAYQAELLDCTRKSSTLAESKACEASVDHKWATARFGVAETSTDGGAK